VSAVAKEGEEKIKRLLEGTKDQRQSREGGGREGGSKAKRDRNGGGRRGNQIKNSERTPNNNSSKGLTQKEIKNKDKKPIEEQTNYMKTAQRSNNKD
jgi:hypothetical protein